MKLPATSRFQFTPDMQICRLLNGMWQVSGGHGQINQDNAIRNMFDYLDAGFTSWDLADHYGPAEDFIGRFRKQLANASGNDALANIQTFTKWVPAPGPMLRHIVENNIDISRRRMDVECLDLLQFHWWDYADARYVEALRHMSDLRNEGKIRHLGLTNFDTEHVQRIVEQGIQVVSNQVQYSLIDRRPEVRMAPFCETNGIHLLTYGTLAGGLLSHAYLGQPEPRGAALNTVSLRKYKGMVDAWGGWALLQKLLEVLHVIALKHQVSIANVAVRAILNRPTVAGVIIGTRLGLSDRREDNANVFSFSLDADDHEQIQTVLDKSHDLFQQIGDCGAEYRR